MFVGTLRKLRHGPLRSFGPLWIFGGRFYRAFIKHAQISAAVRQKIGPYGPYKIHPNFTFSNFSSWGGAHNKGFVACVEACRGKKSVIDVGAHIGLVSLPISSVLASEGKVFAFEPSKTNRKYLNYHIKTNAIKNIETLDVLVGKKNQDNITFYEDSADNGMNSVVNLQGKGDFIEVTKSEISLDKFCKAKVIQPEIIKIDVEGAEINVIEGARQTLLAFRPTIFLSVHPEHIKKLGQSLDDLLELIDALSYDIRTIKGLPVKKFVLDEYLMTPKEKH